MAENFSLQVSDVQCYEIYDACKPMYDASEIFEVEYYGFTICVESLTNDGTLFSGYAVKTEHLETYLKCKDTLEFEWDDAMDDVEYQTVTPHDDSMNFLLDADCKNKFSVFAALSGWVARHVNDYQ